MGPAAHRLRNEFPDVDLVDVGDGPLPDGDAEVLFGGWADDKVLPLIERGVQWVQLPGTGIDGVNADVLARVPVVTCARGASAVPISEYVLAVMLAFEKGFPQHWLSEPPPHWNFQRMDTLAGKAVALIGLGGIGSAIATRAQAFGMRVVALRRTDAPSPVPDVEVVTSLGALLPGADHVVVAAPATPRTVGLLDADAFALMKRGVHLVNIARGTVVYLDALRAALDDGRVARASLDTVDPEPLPDGHWMYSHPRVLLTPHSSWASRAILDAAIDIFAANLRRYLAGEPLEHVVDLAEGY
jgi:phosphoglycerate dehydrogenase-like enzyme